MDALTMPQCEFGGGCEKKAVWFAVYGSTFPYLIENEARLCSEHVREVRNNKARFNVEELIIQHIDQSRLCYNCHLRYNTRGPWCEECFRGAMAQGRLP